MINQNIYIVHSDLDENNDSREFDTLEEAVVYGLEIGEPYAWIEVRELTIDEDGTIVDDVRVEEYNYLEETKNYLVEGN